MMPSATSDARPAPASVTSQRYADLDGWRRYQEFFPPAMRCTAETIPKEEWWAWQGIDVPLDRSPVPASPVKIIVLHGAGAYGRVMAPAAVLTRVPRARFVYALWVDCVRDLIDAELARDGRPVILFGVDT